MIKSTKNPIVTQFVQAYGIVIVVLGYILVLFTDLSQKMMEFMRLFCLIMFKNPNKSTLYVSMSKGLLLLDPYSVTS